jgi:hypothetical protein
VVTPGGVERFPGFDVMAQSAMWDEATRDVVTGRVSDVPPITFFSPREERTARALLDRLLAQECEPRVPVVELIDARLAAGEGDGYRHEQMPEDPQAWRLSLAALDDDADARWGSAFADLAVSHQCKVVQEVQNESGSWHGMPAKHVFNLWMRYACTAFYSHPWSWNEIGFGGPAYPRGYANLGIDRREHWEVEDAGKIGARDRGARYSGG